MKRCFVLAAGLFLTLVFCGGGSGGTASKIDDTNRGGSDHLFYIEKAGSHAERARTIEISGTGSTTIYFNPDEPFIVNKLRNMIHGYRINID